LEQEIEEFEQKELEYYEPEAEEPEAEEPEAKLEEQDPLGENRAADEVCRVVVRCIKCHQGEWFLSQCRYGLWFFFIFAISKTNEEKSRIRISNLAEHSDLDPYQ
jgi:hypothetical protein